MGSREALALGRLDELERGSDSEGASTTGVVTIDRECILFCVLGRDPRGEPVGELDLGGKGKKRVRDGKGEE
jgi:hypothetical protein